MWNMYHTHPHYKTRQVEFTKFRCRQFVRNFINGVNLQVRDRLQYSKNYEFSKELDKQQPTWRKKGVKDWLAAHAVFNQVIDTTQRYLKEKDVAQPIQVQSTRSSRSSTSLHNRQFNDYNNIEQYEELPRTQQRNRFKAPQRKRYLDPRDFKRQLRQQGFKPNQGQMYKPIQQPNPRSSRKPDNRVRVHNQRRNKEPEINTYVEPPKISHSYYTSYQKVYINNKIMIN